ncbi:MAG: DNA recombination protein RmuC [Geminicoccaceae bacterium]
MTSLTAEAQLYLAIAFFLGLVLGVLVTLLFARGQERRAEALAEALFEASEDRHRSVSEAMIQNVKATFGDLSLDALNRSSETLVQMAGQNLDAKKALIDEQLRRVGGELDKVGHLMRELERDRVQKYGQLSSQLEHASRRSQELQETTQLLRQALAGTKSRGQWGERLAEEILSVAGFVEDVSFAKQKTLEDGGRPDFTFFLPDGREIHMDVKFPLDNYLRSLEAAAESERDRFERAFLKDVKDKIKQLAERDYAKPSDGSVDYTLLFIPNEPLFGFVQDQAPHLFDEGLAKKVVMCSPMSLFAVLAVIRQAVDNFTFNSRANELLSLMGRFRAEWHKFVEQMGRLGKRIDDLQTDYQALVTTRRKALERPLNRIDAIREQRDVTSALPEIEVAGPQANQDLPSG